MQRVPTTVDHFTGLPTVTMAARVSKYAFGNAKHAHDYRCIVLARCRNNGRGTEAATKRQIGALKSLAAPGRNNACGFQPHHTVSAKGRSRTGRCAHVSTVRNTSMIENCDNGSMGVVPINDSHAANMDIYIVGLRTLQKG